MLPIPRNIKNLLDACIPSHSVLHHCHRILIKKVGLSDLGIFPTHLTIVAWFLDRCETEDGMSKSRRLPNRLRCSSVSERSV